MFATLLGALPRPPRRRRTRAPTPSSRRSSRAGGGRSRARHRRGAGDGPDVPRRGLDATAALTDRAVKQALAGPYSVGPVRRCRASAARRPTLAQADALNRALPTLAAAGCPLIEIHEPAAVADRRRRGRAGAAFEMRTAGCSTASRASHLSLAITGGNADAAGIETLLAAPYASLAVDLIAGPDNWRLVAAHAGRPRDRLRRAARPPTRHDGPEVLLWAAGYAASTGGRGPARVGLATASSLAALSWDAPSARWSDSARRRASRTLPPDERRAALDPRAVDIRSAALGRVRAARRAAPRPDRDPT